MLHVHPFTASPLMRFELMLLPHSLDRVLGSCWRFECGPACGNSNWSNQRAAYAMWLRSVGSPHPACARLASMSQRKLPDTTNAFLSDMSVPKCDGVPLQVKVMGEALIGHTPSRVEDDPLSPIDLLRRGARIRCSKRKISVSERTTGRLLHDIQSQKQPYGYV